MGCDIHLHVEVKIRGEWHHYCIGGQRDYEIFAKMAGVCNYTAIEPISPPRGVPGDVSAVTRIDLERWSTDAHSHSYLDAEEISRLSEWVESRERANNVTIWFFEHVFMGGQYLFSNKFGGLHKYRSEMPSEVEDVRFVFWFDN